MRKVNENDLRLFTKTVLMVSSAAVIALDELDELIVTRRELGHDVDRLVRARSGVAALAAIADYYEKGTCP